MSLCFHYFNYQVVVSILFPVIAIFLIDFISSDISTKKDLLHQSKLPPCRACKVYTDSFRKAMDRTKRNKFDGGDAAWEESNLNSYANSEIRLAEIQELVCTDVEEGRYQCHANNELWESFVEEWWSTKGMDDQLYDPLCIYEVKVCCPKGEYGPKCEPCQDCGEHGRCAGSGTRKGNGQCHCDKEYAGAICDLCAPAHYESFRNYKETDDSAPGGIFLCSSCHRSCAGNCTGAGPADCDACADGWRRMAAADKTECVDIDECAEGSPKRRCKLNEWCVNKAGSYECLACDAACAGCTGDGPDLCIRCGDGYELSVSGGDTCIDSHGEDRRRWVTVTRYLTYVGLCLTTCIVLQRSVWAAAAIGVAVAMYITVSEYVLLHGATQAHGSLNATQLVEQLLPTLPAH